MAMDLSFSIAVNSEQSETNLLNLLAEQLPGGTRDRGYVRIGQNVVKFEENPDFDLERSRDDNDGWEYFRYDCDVFPVDDTTLEAQQRLAQQVIDLLEASRCEAKFLGEFELIQ